MTECARRILNVKARRKDQIGQDVIPQKLPKKELVSFMDFLFNQQYTDRSNNIKMSKVSFPRRIVLKYC